jgi:arginine:ornithine antiporter/lysine permease
MLNLTSVMALIPFLLVAAYAVMLVSRGVTYNKRPQDRTRDLIFASIAAIYCVFLIYAAGFKFLVLSCILYGPGTVLYFWARGEQGKKFFKPVELIIFIATMIGAAVGIHGLATGYITI